MSANHRDDLTLSLVPETGANGLRRAPFTVFVPIFLALVGVAMILFGGLSARNQTATAVGVAAEVDPVATGAIPERDRRRDIEMLDR